jgi:hypothetical protein
VRGPESHMSGPTNGANSKATKATNGANSKATLARRTLRVASKAASLQHHRTKRLTLYFPCFLWVPLFSAIKKH